MRYAAIAFTALGLLSMIPTANAQAFGREERAAQGRAERGAERRERIRERMHENRLKYEAAHANERAIRREQNSIAYRDRTMANTPARQRADARDQKSIRGHMR